VPFLHTIVVREREPQKKERKEGKNRIRRLLLFSRISFAPIREEIRASDESGKEEFHESLQANGEGNEGMGPPKSPFVKRKISHHTEEGGKGEEKISQGEKKNGTRMGNEIRREYWKGNRLRLVS